MMMSSKMVGVAAAAVVLGLAMIGCAEAAPEGQDEGQSEADITKGCLACRLVLHRSICGVSRGMTDDEVRDVLGAPKRTTTEPDMFGDQQLPVWDYGDAQYTFVKSGKHLVVIHLKTQNKLTRTTGGLGVGMTEADLKAKLPAIECSQFNDGRFCRVGQGGDIQPGGSMTLFKMKDGVVIGVEITTAEG